MSLGWMGENSGQMQWRSGGGALVITRVVTTADETNSLSAGASLRQMPSQTLFSGLLSPPFSSGTAGLCIGGGPFSFVTSPSSRASSVHPWGHQRSLPSWSYNPAEMKYNRAWLWRKNLVLVMQYDLSWTGLVLKCRLHTPQTRLSKFRITPGVPGGSVCRCECRYFVTNSWHSHHFIKLIYLFY